MVDLPILYSFRRCPYAMRARLALAASGQSCVLREIVLRDKPASMLQASPKGTVPVLVLCDGTVIDESLDIMHWALHTADPLGWLPDDSAASTRWKHWIAQCDGEFKVLLDRYKYPHRFGEQDGSRFRNQALAFLQSLEKALASNRYLGGDRFGMVDAAIAPFIRQFAHTDKDWFAAQPWADLQAWLNQFEDSPLFQRVMAKYNPWREGQEIVVWPGHNNTGEPGEQYPGDSTRQLAQNPS